MSKIKVTNNEYKKILERVSSEYWKEIFSLSKSLSKEERDVCKKDIELKMDQKLNEYEIIPFTPGVSEEIDGLINSLCTESIILDGYIMYKGNIENNDIMYRYMGKEGYTTLDDSGISTTIYNEKLNLIVGYDEGDIYFSVCEGNEEFNKELNRIKEFYEDEY